MIHNFKLAHRGARFRTVALVAAGLALASCNNADQLGPLSLGDAPADSISGALLEPVDGDTLTDAELDANEALGEAAFVTGRTAPGIAFGISGLPSNKLNSSLTGTFRSVSPSSILGILAAARRSGARVVVRMSRGPSYWTNRNHSVNLAKWKAQIARFKRVNLKPYIADGTLLGHYLIDEPHDNSNWGGRPVPYSTIEAMAKYSKQLWPGLTTVVRSYPDWLAKAPFRWKYVDAAWAQYSARKGEVHSWARAQASYAKREGLGLIVGMNMLDGGTRASHIRGTRSGLYGMSPSQIRNFGAVLASTPHACAVYNWSYSTGYLNRSGIKSAIAYVASKSRNRSRQSCRV